MVLWDLPFEFSIMFFSVVCCFHSCTRLCCCACGAEFPQTEVHLVGGQAETLLSLFAHTCHEPFLSVSLMVHTEALFKPTMSVLALYAWIP